ncbi:hypothetical protein LEP1GSC096_0035 [Leptospira interrogans serovar Hebdomadis str. R499]|uniref:hypothetical protein n=1 Tax=Leptospira interrogans TaxID=173 RepID=UPI000297FBD5|nr:hypothetical protein [Leptospira interrogans]EKR34387.1 hypothetical protein LEP1GSC096_0035 [Leptospira interrogans serovar Hebdomadis str. R499]
MAQETYYASHKFVFVNGVLLKDCIKWPDFKQDVQKTEVANDEKYIFNIQTGMIKLEPLEFEFNKTKAADSAHHYLQIWRDAKDDRQVTIIETDATADPFNPNCIVAEWDLGKCQLASLMYPGGEKAAPVAGKIVAEILPKRLAIRTI